MVVWAVVVFVIAMRHGKNVRRVALRKAHRAAAVAVLLSLFTVSGCANGPAPDGRPWTVREDSTLTAETKDFTEKADAATAAADKKWAAAVDGWAALARGAGRGWRDGRSGPAARANRTSASVCGPPHWMPGLPPEADEKRRTRSGPNLPPTKPN